MLPLDARLVLTRQTSFAVLGHPQADSSTMCWHPHSVQVESASRQHLAACRLVAANTVEENMLQLRADKHALEQVPSLLGRSYHSFLHTSVSGSRPVFAIDAAARSPGRGRFNTSHCLGPQPKSWVWACCHPAQPFWTICSNLDCAGVDARAARCSTCLGIPCSPCIGRRAAPRRAEARGRTGC